MFKSDRRRYLCSTRIDLHLEMPYSLLLIAQRASETHAAQRANVTGLARTRYHYCYYFFLTCSFIFYIVPLLLLLLYTVLLLISLSLLLSIHFYHYCYHDHHHCSYYYRCLRTNTPPEKIIITLRTISLKDTKSVAG